MNSKETIDLQKLIANATEEYEDNTEYLRNTKPSVAIRNDLLIIESLKKTYSDQKFVEMAQKEAFFLYTNYTYIFNKVIKDEIDMDIINVFINVLKQIEDGEIDQNEGSVLIGKLLKDIYIDSALKRSVKLDEEYGKPEIKTEGRQIGWKSWKSNGYIEKRNEILKTLNK